jgi:hypothetical protein
MVKSLTDMEMGGHTNGHDISSSTVASPKSLKLVLGLSATS